MSVVVRRPAGCPMVGPGPLPRPPLPDDAAPEALLDAVLALQLEHGLEPLTDGGAATEAADAAAAAAASAASAPAAPAPVEKEKK